MSFAIFLVYHSRHVESNGAGLEQRSSSLQTQLDDRRSAESDDTLPLEQRLSTLTDYTEGILKRWAATADRHARAVGQLEAHLRELGDAGSRLQHDASQRLHDLEGIVQQEWSALRDLHEAPVRQLVEHATALTEVCIATANSAQHGFDRAEARLATLEADFHRTASELTREVQTLVAEVRQLSFNGARQLGSETPSWPLEGVTRLHQQLRESASGPRTLPAAGALELPAADVNPAGAAPPVAVDPAQDTARPETVATEMVTPFTSGMGERDPHHGPARGGSPAKAIAIATVILLVVAGGFTWRLREDVRAATQQAERSQERSRLAEAASREASQKQQAADRELTAARDLAARAQTIGDVLAAPDLVRFTLTNPASLPGATGQVLWSRSRGFVFSGSGLPAPPADATYQVWLLTRAGAVSAATFVPDAAGRVTVTSTPSVPRAAFGAIVTTERREGATTPTGEPVLARLPALVTPPS